MSYLWVNPRNVEIPVSENPTQFENTLANIWREAFANWPSDFRRKGVVVPSFGEAIPFVDFVLNKDMVVLERATPDTVGARRVAIPFRHIEALKYTEPLNTEQFLGNGFVQGLSCPVAAPQPTESANQSASGQPITPSS